MGRRLRTRVRKDVPIPGEPAQAWCVIICKPGGLQTTANFQDPGAKALPAPNFQVNSKALMITITDLEALDLRFPTSRTAAGSDAMHKDPDYSAAYVILKTSAGLEGHGLTFTIGRGNELCVAAIGALRHLVVG